MLPAGIMAAGSGRNDPILKTSAKIMTAMQHETEILQSFTMTSPLPNFQQYNCDDSDSDPSPLLQTSTNIYYKQCETEGMAIMSPLQRGHRKCLSPLEQSSPITAAYPKYPFQLYP